MIVRALLVLTLLVACEGPPPSTDAGADPEISDCCLWFVVPLLYDRPQVCLEKHTHPGECRWLECLGGLATYTACKPDE